MDKALRIYNTLNRKKETFKPLHSPLVGMYVCGPTVYGDPHLGHARPAITFDLVFRYLNHLGYNVRYVRNITDVGHLEEDLDFGEDKISKKARLEQLEPMEVVQRYTNEYRLKMMQLNVLPPSIEPTASGHILEQQNLVERILEKGYAYEKGGSVYFDVEKYGRDHHYGKLSGRKIEDLVSNTRELEKQVEKKSPMDFAIWKNADPEHLMRWPSRWGEGFPGWHLECSVMSLRYLGEEFDIHGGGMDLLFPHHECEIAQTVAAYGKESVRYWMHNNMITLNGQKMGKSLGNAINLEQFFTGEHELLERGFAPMTIRFFMLQAHYRSTLDFSNDALTAAEKGMERLFEGIENLDKISPAKNPGTDIIKIEKAFFDAMNDDFNTPIAIAHLFDGIKLINSALDGRGFFSSGDLEKWKAFYNVAVFDILGLRAPEGKGTEGSLSDSLIQVLLQMRIDARNSKNFEMADRIRDEMIRLGIEVKDTKDGFEWKLTK
ncbi:cysteine--tRNA ligase [Bacteroidota bacterium]